LRQSFTKTQLCFSVPRGGMFLWCRTCDGPTAAELNRRAIAQGVVFTPGELFYPEISESRELRLCFAGTPVSKIEDGIERLRIAFAAQTLTESGLPLVRA
jgi:2-aminoadipate transaminase